MRRDRRMPAHVALAGLAIGPFAVFGVSAAAAEAAVPACKGVEATVVGTAGPDVLVGTAERDVIWGGAGADEIRGLAGNDWICGGAGNDVIDPGPGAADGAHDYAFGQEGNDRLVSLVANARAYGGEGDDRLRGTSAPAPTPDPWGQLHGGAGDDRIFAGTSRAELSGDGGNDLIEGSDAADLIDPGTGSDVVLAAGGADRILGWIGEGDVIEGGEGADTLDYGALDRSRGPVRVNLTTGAARRIGGLAEDQLTSVSHVLGTSLADVLIGDATDNVLDGRRGHDLVLGRGGVDELIGAVGDDYLDGGRPAGASDLDTARGGPGADQCYNVGVLFNCETS
jgi:Ca2+-binding RTX toxin-like protein